MPYVGLNAFAIGERVGEELATFYEESGWSKDSVGVVSIEDRKADTCMQRNGGAEKALLENSDLTEDQIVRAAYDNTMVNSIDVMTTTLTANPQYDHWIFYACNDDGVLEGAHCPPRLGAQRAWPRGRLERVIQKAAVEVPELLLLIQ